MLLAASRPGLRATTAVQWRAAPVEGNISSTLAAGDSGRRGIILGKPTISLPKGTNVLATVIVRVTKGMIHPGKRRMLWRKGMMRLTKEIVPLPKETMLLGKKPMRMAKRMIHLRAGMTGLAKEIVHLVQQTVLLAKPATVLVAQMMPLTAFSYAFGDPWPSWSAVFVH